MQPCELYVSSDGPIPNDEQSAELVQRCRHTIATMINWPCNTYFRYLPKNMGCRDAVSTAITWFFDNVDAGIIIEDDVVCDKTFFEYSSQLLCKYYGSQAVASISANCFNSNLTRHPDSSYTFSCHPHVWGWATWAYVWKQYDVGIQSFRPLSFALSHLPRLGLRSTLFWTHTFIKLKSGKINTWDYQLSYLFYTRGFYSIIPKVELAANTGFNSDASHTSHGVSPLAASSSLEFPLKHPRSICTSRKRDRLTLVTNYLPSVRYLLQKLLPFPGFL